MKEKESGISLLEQMPMESHEAEHLQMSETDRLLCLAMDVGEHMLRCGGEIHRVEDTVERICRAYGAAHVEVFVIPSLVMAAIRMSDGAYSSQIRRVYRTAKDFYKLEQFNRISRVMCGERPDFDEAERMIREAKHAKPYSDFWVFLGTVLLSGGFAIFFGGSWRDALAASMVCLILAVIERLLGNHINEMAKTFFLSFVLGVLSFLSVAVGIGQDIGIVTIGVIMMLIPGIEMGNALRDLLYGNLLSGSLRIAQSVLLAAMIALGYAASLFVTGGML